MEFDPTRLNHSLVPQEDSSSCDTSSLDQSIWTDPENVRADRTPESLCWEQTKRVAQIQALELLQGLFIDEHHIPVLEHPWSDALYPSLVKIWGIDSRNEEAALYFDQVWLHRLHPDRPQQWNIIATTTDDCPLTETLCSDGTWAREGTRAYVDDMLSHMLSSSEKSVRDLGSVLSTALANGQLRYRHLHISQDPDTQILQIDDLYEFPIYSTADWNDSSME
jgi:hypothetical protein